MAGRRRRAAAGIVAAGLLGALGATPATAQLPLLPPGGGTAPPPPNPPVVDAAIDDAVTALDGQHHTRATTTTVKGPLGVAWTAKVTGDVRQLLAIPGTLITSGSSLTALDPATGAVRWTVPGAGEGAAIVGDAVVATRGDDLVSHDLGTGALRWTAVGAGDGFSGAPVPAGDLVIAQPLTNGTSFARGLDAATGAQRWRVDVPNPGVPAVVGDRVYLPGCGGGFQVVDRPSGTVVDSRSSGCGGGISYTAGAFARTVRIGTETAFSTTDLATGPVVRWDAATPAIGVMAGSTTLLGVDPVSGQGRWTAKTPFGAGRAWIAGSSVVNVTDQGIQLLDAATGATTWQGQFAKPSGSFSDGGRITIAAAGQVFTAAGSTVTALRTGAPGRTPKLAGKIARFRTITFGQAFTVSGTARDRPILTRREVRLQTRRFPARRSRTTVVGKTGIRTDGAFKVRLKPDRFTSYRLRVAGATGSREFAAIVLPRTRDRFSRSGADNNSITLRTTITVPKDMRIAGRTYAVYVGRAGAKRYVRLGSGRIRRLGKGRGRATVRFRAVTFGRRDFIRVCISGLSRQGLSFNDRLDRQCGRSTIRF